MRIKTKIEILKRRIFIARIYGNNSELTERERLERKYNGARTNLLFALGFTLVNIVLLFTDSTSYFLFSLYVPYYIALFGCILSVKMPAEFYVDEFVAITGKDKIALKN